MRGVNISVSQSGLAVWFLSIFLSCPSAALAAEKAPGFDLPGPDSPVKLSDFRGQVVYLDFWASWCAPCLKSFPWMEQIQQRYRPRGLTVIAINLDQEPELAQKFLTEHPSNFVIGYDPAGITPKAYSVQGMPTSFIIDRDGNILSTHIGFNSDNKQAYEQAIDRALRSASLARATSSVQASGAQP